ncbi:MAG: ATP-grasp domain-containing protein [Defluviitaleaceae bacterium]|nr:ATP-grasp domain-containing protein [Defluviitaleaceae bacterium]
MLILFPSDYFDTKQPDSDYRTEYEAVCRIPEFKIILYNHDSFTQGEPLKIYPSNYYTGDCIYRGWMLNPIQYEALYIFLKNKGTTLINTPEQYNYCHLFPNVYPQIKEYTPRILCYGHEQPINWDYVNNTLKRFMVKDYVKSVKGCDFPAFFETPVKSKDMDIHIASFVEHRGSLFTGGIVLKEYVDLKKYGNATNEYRAFYLQNELLSLSRNSNQADSCPPPPQTLIDSVKTLQSQYYTVDFAELADGTWIVLETGDGQVSGLSPGQWEFKYYDDMRSIVAAAHILK